MFVSFQPKDLCPSFFQMMDVLTAIGYLLLLVIGYKLFFRILRIPKISHLDSHYILITGCDSGFGNATAKRLDSLGCHVIAACFTENGETELRESSSSKLHTVGLDVTSEKNVERAYQEITRKILPAGKGMDLSLKNLAPKEMKNKVCFFIFFFFLGVCFSINIF